MNESATSSSAKANPPSPEGGTLLAAFQRLRGSLLRMARRMLQNEDEAEDALQDAFCRLWNKPAAQRSEQEAAALLTATVKHVSIDTLRRKSRGATLPLDEERDELPDDGTAAAQEREATFARVGHIIATRLTDTQREVLRLREYEGWGFEAIAARLGMQPAAVRMQLSRARQTIRNCYLEQYEKK